MRDSLSSSFIPFGGVKRSSYQDPFPEPKKNKMGQSTLLSSISKTALDVLAEQALLDYNQPFKPFGNKVFYYNGFDCRRCAQWSWDDFFG